MQRRSQLDATSLIVFLSILTIVVQFTAYYFTSSTLIIFGTACFISILSNHILQNHTLTFQASFIYTLLTVFISLIIAILVFFGKELSYFPFTDVILGIVAINWLIPTSYSLIRNMFDSGERIEDFSRFYRNNNFIFLAFYLALLTYGALSAEAFPWAYRAVSTKANFTPFWSVATQIEDYLNQKIPLSDIIVYLSSRIFIYIPNGFYMTLLCRRTRRSLRFLSLLLLPALIEGVQFILTPVRSDIDDVIYALLGSLIGSLTFYLLSLIYTGISGRKFLARSSDYRYSNNSLHF